MTLKSNMDSRFVALWKIVLNKEEKKKRKGKNEEEEEEEKKKLLEREVVEEGKWEEKIRKRKKIENYTAPNTLNLDCIFSLEDGHVESNAWFKITKKDLKYTEKKTRTERKKTHWM